MYLQKEKLISHFIFGIIVSVSVLGIKKKKSNYFPRVANYDYYTCLGCIFSLMQILL